MKDKINVNINGAISGIVNFGNNSININEKKENNISRLDKNNIISNNDNFTQLKKDKLSSNIVKIIVEVIVGVMISVIAAYILYKLNIN